MCQLFVENCREDDQQIMLFYYWMLDVCECYEELQQSKVSKKFKDCLQLAPDKCLLIESLWLIDHRLYKVCFFILIFGQVFNKSVIADQITSKIYC